MERRPAQATLTTYLFKGKEVILATRSMRNKLRWQAEMIEKGLIKCQGHLQFIDDMAEGQSSYINEYVPTLTVLLEEMIKTVNSFRQGL